MKDFIRIVPEEWYWDGHLQHVLWTLNGTEVNNKLILTTPNHMFSVVLCDCLKACCSVNYAHFQWKVILVYVNAIANTIGPNTWE